MDHLTQSCVAHPHLKFQLQSCLTIQSGCCANLDITNHEKAFVPIAESPLQKKETLLLKTETFESDFSSQIKAHQTLFGPETPSMFTPSCWGNGLEVQRLHHPTVPLLNNYTLAIANYIQVLRDENDTPKELCRLLRLAEPGWSGCGAPRRGTCISQLKFLH